jgi:ubiquitin-protein ligase
MREYKKVYLQYVQNEPHPAYLCEYSEDHWYCVALCSQDYLFEVIIPQAYPVSPPYAHMITPSSIFKAVDPCMPEVCYTIMDVVKYIVSELQTASPLMQLSVSESNRIASIKEFNNYE